MDKRTARAWFIFVVVAMVIHGIGEAFDITPITFVIIMFGLIAFTLKYVPDKKP